MNNKNRPKQQNKPLSLNLTTSGIVVSGSDNNQTQININESVSMESIISSPVVEGTTQAQALPLSSDNVRYDYKVVVTRNNLDVFQLTVKEHLNDGWELSGGVSCTMYSDSYSASTIWSQAIYKKISK
jgi:hypothetical protein